MFGISMWELLLVGLVLFLVVGPQKLPGLAKQVGKGLKDLRSSLNDIKGQVDTDDEFVKAVREAKQSVAEAKEAVRSMFDDVVDDPRASASDEDPAPQPVPRGRKMIKPASRAEESATGEGPVDQPAGSAAPVEAEVWRADAKAKPAPSPPPSPAPRAELAEAAPAPEPEKPVVKPGRRMVRPGRKKD